MSRHLSMIFASVLTAWCGVGIAHGEVRPQIPASVRGNDVDTHHGVAVEDPYRWLEKSNSWAVKSWSFAQNAVTRDYIERLPQWLPIANRLTQLTKVENTDFDGLRFVGSKGFVWFQDPARHQRPVLAGMTGMDRKTLKEILDPQRFGDAATIDWFVPSPNGHLVAVSVSENGTESGTLRIIDLRSGKEADRPIERVQQATAAGSVAWRSDSSGFWYTRYPPDSLFHQRVYYHRLGQDAAHDRMILGPELPRIAEIDLDNGNGTKPLIASVANGDGGEFEHFLIPDDGTPVRLATFGDRVAYVATAPDRSLYFASFKDAPRGRILTLPPGQTALDKAQEIIPQGPLSLLPVQDRKVRPLVVTATRIYVSVVDGGPIGVGIFDRKGKPIGSLPSPDLASVGPVLPVGDGQVAYGVETFFTPFRYRLYDEPTGVASDTWLTKAATLDFSDAVLTREYAIADDGARIPVTIVGRKDVERNGKAPLLLYGYGGYGLVQSPFALTASHRVWLDGGGVYALANIRGGGEYGPEWHRAGNLTRKNRAFADFAAIATHLVARGWADPQRLAFRGASNGGLLMGAMLAHYPGLARAIVSEVGFYDSLRTELFPNGEFNVTEFGTVADPEQFRALHAYSPYHRLAKGTKFPSVLLTTDEDDNRVEAMQSRKMAAALQWANGGDNPILLRTSSGTGHGVGQSIDATIADKADVYAFLFAQLGMSLPEKPGP